MTNHRWHYRCSFVRLSVFLVQFRTSPEYLTWEMAHVFTSLVRFLLQSSVSRYFLVLLWFSFLIFYFHPSLLNGVRSKYSQIFVILFLYKYSDVFHIGQFSSFCCFSFPTFHHQHGTFFNSKFRSYILIDYNYEDH